MAYGAVGSLELTIERLLESSHISIAQNSSPHIIKLLHEEILSVKEALGEFDTRRSTINMKMVKNLEAEIIDVVYQFEDVIDPHLSDQFHSRPEEEETDHPLLLLFTVDLEEIKQDVDSFILTMNKMKRDYIHELCNPSPDEEEDDVVPSRICFGGNGSNIVGLSDLFTRIKDRLNSSRGERMIVSLEGMAGIGKTTLAKKLFADPSSVSCYSRLVFVTIGPKYRRVDILVDILTQLNPDVDEIIRMEGEKVLAGLKRMVYKSFKYLSYLIVLDDVWDKELCHELLNLFPDDNNGSRVLVTTRLWEVADCAQPWNAFTIPFLDKKESWDLLREQVFGRESCSYGFAKAGNKIAENCEGHPLTIVTVANILSVAEKTLDYWNKVADDKQNLVYKDAYDQTSNVLYPSYNYLPQRLKACFLYVGAFPQKVSVYMYELLNLWSVEGFLNSKSMHYFHSAITSTNVPYDYFYGLYSKNLLMFDIETGGYRLHSSFWYMCNEEAAKNKLFYALNCLADALPAEGINYERRLCIRNNVLLAIKDVRNSIASTSMVRSLLCTGDYHEYPVQLCLERLRLLRVLEAHSVRLYEFPLEVLKLVQLRHLNLTYDGNLPSSISNLWNLQHLGIYRHQTIINSDRNPSYYPTEIWDMKELKCLETQGRDLPHPCEGSFLPNLVTLNGVGPQSCTEHVLERIPNLKVLTIFIYLAPDATEPLSCFGCIPLLHKLEGLQCYMKNPILKTEVVTPLSPPLSDFPSSLTKLNLSGSFGYPWAQMCKISSLPYLKTLILECYAFRGPKWEVHDNEFQKLESLRIEDTDLEQWTFQNDSCLRAIDKLTFTHCYKLKEIPLTFGTSLRKIEVLDCNPMAVNCASKLKQDGKRSLKVSVRSSWDDGNI